MADDDTLDEVLMPLVRRIAQCNLADPAGAQDALNRDLPTSSLDAVRTRLLAAHGAGRLTPRRGSDTLSFGRVAKATPATEGLSIDAVDMSAAGPGHTHPNGEVSLCFALEGDPRFMGCPEGWVVAGPGSHHVPTVTGGRMLIVYFLPDGAMEWDA